MTQYLRLHARDCDFSATVLKARQYADAAETTRPKKTVRIIKKPSQIIEPSADEDETVGFQPLIEGIRDAIRMLLHPLPLMLLRSPEVNLLEVKDETRIRSLGHSHLILVSS